eukprot:3231248-Amphidinium_carterae.1
MLGAFLMTTQCNSATKLKKPSRSLQKLNSHFYSNSDAEMVHSASFSKPTENKAWHGIALDVCKDAFACKRGACLDGTEEATLWQHSALVACRHRCLLQSPHLKQASEPLCIIS